MLLLDADSIEHLNYFSHPSNVSFPLQIALLILLKVFKIKKLDIGHFKEIIT